MQTLSESGYKGWPYIHDSRGVCFVWHGRSRVTLKPTKDLAWTSFSWTRDTGMLGRSDTGSLVPVHVPSAHYDKTLEQMFEEAKVSPLLYRLRCYKEWIGPFLYMQPSKRMEIGQQGYPLVLHVTAPATSAGIPLRYDMSSLAGRPASGASIAA